ncbi:MAG: DUF4347 domain-containing protein, partial [Granulosicoccus sp.]
MGHRAKKSGDLAPVFHLETLEKRILFSADAALSAIDMAPDPAAELVVLERSEFNKLSSVSTVQAEDILPRELVILDSGLPDIQILLDDLTQSELEDAQIVVLDADTDALTQISAILAEQRGLTAVHVFSHGSSGALHFAEQRIDTLDLLSRADELAQWRSAFAPGADILLYGCDVAENGEGQDFVDTIARLAGADVSASNDLTGDADQDGDWQLEYSIGDVESELVFNARGAANWEHVLANYTVTNTNDIGAGSLRQAISDANTNSGADTINFNIPGSGTQIIDVGSTLTITDTVVIDGTTQAGWSAGSFIPVVIDADGGNFVGLRLTNIADGSTISGLVIRDVAEVGLFIDNGSSGNTITGNFIGSFNSDGTVAIGEEIRSAAIGVEGDSNSIGGTTIVERNVLAGGVNGIVTAGATNGTISGNYIGTDATGNVVIGTTFDGVRLDFGTTGMTVGGASAGAGNLIAGVGDEGIEVRDETSDGNTVINNSIGLLADGTTVSGSGNSGIRIGAGADNTTIGGVGVGNVVVGSGSLGIEISGASTGTTVYGNLIGTNASGTAIAGNGLSGIMLENGAQNNTIGGIGPGQGNLITGSGTLSATDNAGITLLSTAGSGNSIAGNSVISNAGVGIDLGGDGITLNDAGDADTGPNDLQNSAVLLSASIADDGTFAYELDTTTLATGSYTIDFYASTDRDGGHTEGDRYLGRATGVAHGNATMTGALSGITLATGEYVTLVTTDASGNSSEFSNYAVAIDSDPDGATPSNLEVISTSFGGLSINEDGGDDIYLEADDGSSILNGLTDLTLEFQFTAQPIPNDSFQSLLSYATPDNASALGVFAYKSADGLTQWIGMDIDGEWHQVTTDLDQIFDRNRHALSVTWSNSSGAWQIFSDGALIASGTGLATGNTLDGGGKLVIGQNLGNGANNYQFFTDYAFKGTMHTVRIFDDVRTSAEIAASYHTDLSFDESGMIANWRFDRLSKDRIVTDAVSNNNLSIRHVVQSGFTASDSSLSLQVSENVTDGAVVGSVSGFDAEREARIAQLLANDPNLRYSAEADKFFRVKNGNYTWSVALADASNPAIPNSVLNGVTGQLGTIRSAAEHAIVAELAATFNNQLYVAGTDKDIEGQWQWYNGGVAEDTFWTGDGSGSSVDENYSNFGVGEPNNFGNEDYLSVEISGGWNDLDTASALAYLVEWDADTVLDATDALTYSIDSQTVPGAFALDSDSGLISVADDSLIDYEAATSHNLSVEVTDKFGNTYSEILAISVENELEVAQSIPGAQAVNEDVPLIFSALNTVHNAVSVSDTLSDTNTPMQVVLSVNDGVLNLSGLNGITIVDGAQGSSSMTLNGLESDINAALEGMTFTPTSDFNGSVTLDMSTALAADLAGYYTFDDGFANDQSAGTAYDGTLNGDAAIVGQALSLDGSGDSMSIASVYGSPPDVTLATWINLDPAAGIGEVISLGNNLAIRVNTSPGDLSFFWYDGSTFNSIVATNVDLNNRGWSHIAATFDDTNDRVTAYLDGEIIAMQSTVDSIGYVLNTDTYFGANGSGGGTHSYHGLIDDARVYTRALSADEIVALANYTAESSDSVAIAVNAVNDVPVFSNLNGNPTFVEGAAAVVLDSDVTVADIELSGLDNFNGATLTLTRDGGANNDDILDFDGVNVTVSGANVSVAGTQVGTYSFAGGQLAVAFDANATNARVNTLMQNILYSNSSDEPPSSVQIDWTFNDGNTGAQGSSGSLTANGDTTTTITAVNDAPALTATAVNPTFVEGASAVILYSAAAASTIEAGQTLNSLVLTVTNVTDGTDEILGADGSTFALTNSNSGTTVGTGYGYAVSLNGSDATVTFTTTGATAGAIETLVDGLSYNNTSNDPTTTARAVTITSLMDSGDTANSGAHTSSPAVASTVTMSALNDAPVLDLDADNSSSPGVDFATTWTENSGPVAVADIDATLIDPDSNMLASLSVTLSNVPDGSDEVLTADTTGTSIVASYNSLTGVLLLNGSHSLEDYEQVLTTITYDNTSEVPDGTARVITFVADDGAIVSPLASTTISITALNDAPTNTGTLPTDITVTEDAFSAVDLSAIDLADVDADNSSLTLTLSTSTGGNLSAAAGTGITLGGSGSASVTLSGSL